jgi:hypothetical protein
MGYDDRRYIEVVDHIVQWRDLVLDVLSLRATVLRYVCILHSQNTGFWFLVCLWIRLKQLIFSETR